jgi:hypothetical protein
MEMMDLNVTPEEERWRAMVRSWLEANFPAGWGTPAYMPRPRKTRLRSPVRGNAGSSTAVECRHDRVGA